AEGAGQDPGARRVTDDDAGHLDQADAARVAEVEADDRRDAHEADTEADEAPVVEALSARRYGERDADERRRRDQQCRERARDAALGAREQHPRDRDLDHGEEGNPAPASEYRAQRVAVYWEWQQDQRREARAQEDERRRRHLAHGDADQEVRNPPDHAHGCEQHPPAPRHLEGLTNAGGRTVRWAVHFAGPPT